MSHSGVFISYRRGTGSEVARIMQEFLEGQGFDVFLDVDSLGAGHFDEQLLREIESRRSFVLICSPGCLDRCVNEGDWVRRELEYAIKARRHIVPVTMPQFVWPSSETMPPVVGELQRHNAFEYSHSHWRLIKPRLVEMLRAGRTNSGPQPPRTEPSPAVEPIGLRMEEENHHSLRSAVMPQTRGVQSWCEVLEESPNASVVTDAAARARMIATKLPWKVRDRKTGIVMLLCPPGEFMMGSPATEAGRSEDERQHRRTIGTAFYIGETQVTQEQWKRIMVANPSHFKGATNPVEQVSWDDCKCFCVLTGLRLPSEAEWEYACRAGTTDAYAGDLDSMAWFANNSGRAALDAEALWARGQAGYGKVVWDNGCQPHAVRQRRANGWGLFDMHGNVWEWCEDCYGAYPEGPATQAAARAAEGGARVFRGGGWFNDASNCRAADRQNLSRAITDFSIGFRVARTSG